MPIDMPRGLPFAVDTWGPSSRHLRHRFLTHAHTDHLVGAGAAAAGGAGGTVYATRLTLSLALRRFPQLESFEFVDMEVGRTVAVDDPAGAFSVTAYDANHCPGAVMFLFEGQFGAILHTGDCRLTSDCIQNLPTKYTAKKGNENICRLDCVLLDCTFSKCFLKLPSKESAIQQVIACIWKHPRAPFVYLACDLLGHEDVLIEVSRTFVSKIYVDRRLDCFKTLSLTAPEIITDDPSSRFQVVGFRQLYDKASRELKEAKASLLPEPLFIRTSTQWYASCVQSWKPSLTEAERDEYGVWRICFSIHSSRDELEQALQLLQPKWVISTTPSCFAIELSYVKKLMKCTPIKDINQASYKTKIWARLTRLFEYILNDKPDQIQRLQFVLLDHEGHAIEAQVPQQHVNRFIPHLQEGTVYFIEFFRVIPCRSNYRAVSHAYMIKFTSHTKITEFTKLTEFNDVPATFPKYAYTLSSFDTLRNKIDYTTELSDTIGRVIFVEPAATTYVKGIKKAIRRLYISDGRESIEVVLWSRQATEFPVERIIELSKQKPVILLLLGSIAKSYEGRLQIEGSISCQYHINPTIPEATALLERRVMSRRRETFFASEIAANWSAGTPPPTMKRLISSEDDLSPASESVPRLHASNSAKEKRDVRRRLDN